MKTNTMRLDNDIRWCKFANFTLDELVHTLTVVSVKNGGAKILKKIKLSFDSFSEKTDFHVIPKNTYIISVSKFSIFTN